MSVRSRTRLGSRSTGGLPCGRLDVVGPGRGEARLGVHLDPGGAEGVLDEVVDDVALGVERGRRGELLGVLDLAALRELGVDLVLELGAPVLVDPAHDLVLGEDRGRDGWVVEGVDRLLPEGQRGEQGGRLVVGIEQHLDPLGHGGTGGAVGGTGDAAFVEACVRVAGPPDERGGPADRVAADQGLGLAVDEEQAALLEAAEGDQAVEQGEGDLLHGSPGGPPRGTRPPGGGSRGPRARRRGPACRRPRGPGHRGAGPPARRRCPRPPAVGGRPPGGRPGAR